MAVFPVQTSSLSTLSPEVANGFEQRIRAALAEANFSVVVITDESPALRRSFLESGLTPTPVSHDLQGESFASITNALDADIGLLVSLTTAAEDMVACTVRVANRAGELSQEYRLSVLRQHQRGTLAEAFGPLAQKVVRQLQNAAAALEQKQKSGASQLEQRLLQQAGDAAKQGQWDVAARIYQRLLAVAPDHSDYYLLLARANLERGLDDRALADLKRCLYLDANNPEAHRLLAELYLKRQDYPRAADHVGKLLAVKPEDASAHKLAGDIYVAHWKDARNRQREATANRLLTQALDHYQRAIAIDPASTPALELGDFLYDQRRYDDAIAQYRRAVQEAPSNSHAQQRLIECLLLQPHGEKQAAAAFFDWVHQSGDAPLSLERSVYLGITRILHQQARETFIQVQTWERQYREHEITREQYAARLREAAEAARAMSELLDDRIKPPAKFAVTHRERINAYDQMAQFLRLLMVYVETGDPDYAERSRLQLQTAVERFDEASMHEGRLQSR